MTIVENSLCGYTVHLRVDTPSYYIYSVVSKLELPQNRAIFSHWKNRQCVVGGGEGANIKTGSLQPFSEKGHAFNISLRATRSIFPFEIIFEREIWNEWPNERNVFRRILCAWRRFFSLGQICRVLHSTYFFLTRLCDGTIKEDMIWVIVSPLIKFFQKNQQQITTNISASQTLLYIKKQQQHIFVFRARSIMNYLLPCRLHFTLSRTASVLELWFHTFYTVRFHGFHDITISGRNLQLLPLAEIHCGFCH